MPAHPALSSRGQLLGEHHGNASKALFGMIAGALFSLFCILGIATRPDPSMRLIASAIVAPVATLWAASECRRLQRLTLRLYENGIELRDRRGEQTLAWEDVTALEARYAPGNHRDGPDNPDNLVALVVIHAGGLMTLRKDLHDLRAIIDGVRARTPAPYREVLLGGAGEDA